MRISNYLWGAMCFVFCACRSQGESSPPRQNQTEGTNYTVERNEAQANVVVPSLAEAQAIRALQDRVAQRPEEIAIRRELGAKAIDLAAGVLWTVGHAKLPGGAAAGGVVRSQAELAARLDASRWAAYLLQWHKTDYAANYGSVQARVGATEVVNTSYTDSTCVVLLKCALE
ncbi:MAG: hypothetical protein ACREOO_17710 [bacterium]